jgi:hypothetical protein
MATHRIGIPFGQPEGNATITRDPDLMKLQKDAGTHIVAWSGVTCTWRLPKRISETHWSCRKVSFALQFEATVPSDTDGSLSP